MTRPENTNRSPSGDFMLGQRRKRWPNIKLKYVLNLGTLIFDAT